MIISVVEYRETMSYTLTKVIFLIIVNENNNQNIRSFEKRNKKGGSTNFESIYKYERNKPAQSPNGLTPYVGISPHLRATC